MTIDITRAPFPVTYRELWLPPSINGNTTLPTSVEGGHGLALTGARKGTTADGVHFTGAADSNINCGAIHNAAVKLWISLRFKLDQDFSSASGANLRLSGKFVGGADYIRVYLDAANGALVLASIVGGVWHFLITVTTSWNAGQWYNVIASMSNVAGMRLRIDGGVAVVNPAYVDAVPNGGDFVIGDGDDPGAGTGFQGVIADFVTGTDDLTEAEEIDLSNGIPPADAVNSWLLDEGRGVTAYDRGSGGNNGTLDTTATWKFGQVRQPVLSLDGINDRGVSSAGIDISGDSTFIWAGKIKSTYGSTSSHYLARLFISNEDQLILYHDLVVDGIIWWVEGANAVSQVIYGTLPAIDDYLVFVGVSAPNGVAKLFVNGSLVGISAGAGAMSTAAAIAYIGRSVGVDFYDVSKPLLVALIDGAFTQKQALAYSRWLKNVFNLPISI